MQNFAMECKPGRTQLTLLTRRLGLALTRGGSQGEGGALGRSLFAHSLRYSRAVGRRSADTALTSLGAWQKQSQMVTLSEKFTSNWKSNSDRNSIKLVKNNVPMNGIGICNATNKCGF